MRKGRLGLGRGLRRGGHRLLLDRLLHLGLTRGEVDLVNRARGAYLYALATETALGMVDVGEVVADRDGVKLALLEALAAANAGIGADLLIDRSLILIDAGDEDAAVFLSFLP